MRIRLLSIFILILSLSLYVIYWKVDRDFFSEKISWNETQSRSQLAALTRALQAELEGYSQVLDLSLPIILDSKSSTYGADQAYSQFQMISKLNGTKVETFFYLADTPVQSWAEKQTPNLPLAAAGQILQVFREGQSKPWVLAKLHSKITQDNYVVIIDTAFLQGLLDREKGLMSEFAVVNDKGQVLAHSKNPEYINLNFNEDPLTQEAMKSTYSSGSGIYGESDSRFHGFFEKVDGTNLMVEVKTPLNLLMSEKDVLKTRFRYLGLGLLSLGIFLILLLEDNKVAEAGPAKGAEMASTPVKAKAPEAKVVVSSGVKQESTHQLPIAEEPLQKANEAGVIVKQPSAEDKKAENRPLTEMAEVTSPSFRKNIPPPPEVMSATENEFEDLFAEKKIREAFEAIDSIESPPPTSKQELAFNHESLTEPPPPPHVSIEVAPPPPPLSESPSRPNIQVPHRESKLDSFTVKVRKPKPGGSHEVE